MFIKVNKRIVRSEKREAISRGVTLVETLIYSAMAAIILGILGMMFIQIYGLYKDITIEPKTDRSVLLTVDRILKDIRSGQDINLENSVFGTTPGELYISAVENAVVVSKFYKLENGQIIYQENGGNENNLTSADIEITKLQFEYLTTGISEGVRVEIDASIEKDGGTEIKEYEGFAILRQSYE